MHQESLEVSLIPMNICIHHRFATRARLMPTGDDGQEHSRLSKS